MSCTLSLSLSLSLSPAAPPTCSCGRRPLSFAAMELFWARSSLFLVGLSLSASPSLSLSLSLWKCTCTYMHHRSAKGAGCEGRLHAPPPAGSLQPSHHLRRGAGEGPVAADGQWGAAAPSLTGCSPAGCGCAGGQGTGNCGSCCHVVAECSRGRTAHHSACATCPAPPQ